MRGLIAKTVAATLGIGVALAGPLAAQNMNASTAVINDYPTEARADYVFVCMATNGQTREGLRRCSCSVDVIASILPYERYVDAETVLRMRQVSGERVAAMRSSADSNDMVRDLRRAQAEGDVRCF